MPLEALAAARARLVGRSSKASDAVRHDSFDAAMYRELIEEAPALAELADRDLGETYDYTRDMIREVVMCFWQGDPRLRTSAEMAPRYLLNRGVADDVLSAPETDHTRTMTRHDRYGAAMATIALTERIKDFLERATEAQEATEAAQQAQDAADQAMDGLQDAAEGLGGTDPADAPSGPLSGGEGPLTEQQAQQLADLLQALDAADQAQDGAGQASEQAQQQVARVQSQMLPAVREGVQQVGDQLSQEAELFSSWGVGDGELQRMSFQERAMLASALRNNRLAAFRKLIGRFRTMAAAQRAKRTEYSRDEFYSVELSGRLGDVVGSEMALLTNRHTRLDFLNRLAQEQLLSRKYRGVEKVGQGSIVCLIDCSGSMAKTDVHGLSREAFAKAGGLALLDSARAAGRDFVGILFSSVGQVEVFRFPKGRADIYELINFAEKFYKGGTDYMRPLELAMDIIDADFNAGLVKADVVLFTDDDCAVSPEWLSAYRERKETMGFRTFGVAVGAHPGSTLASLSDNVRSILEFADPMTVADIFRTV